MSTTGSVRPEVSVVMAVRNDPSGLTVAAGSILAQRGVLLELIVVDDGSTDGTAQVLSRLSETDPRVVPLYAPHQGLTAALVAGCARARAQWIARQDAGDVSSPERLRRQLDLAARHPEVVFVSCWSQALAPRGEPLFVARGGLRSEAPVDLLLPHQTSNNAQPEGEAHTGLAPLSQGAENDGVVGPSWHGATLFQRAAYERVGGYRPAFRLAQDWDLWWRLAEVGRFALVPQVLYTCTLQETSLSLTQGGPQRQLAALGRAAAWGRRTGQGEQAAVAEASTLSAELAARKRPLSRRSLARANYFLGAQLASSGSHGAATHYLAKAFFLDLTHLRAFARFVAAAMIASVQALTARHGTTGPPS